MTSDYRIVIRGPVPERYLAEYRDEFAISSTDSCTVLTGRIKDSSQLHGIVSYLTNVGLQLVEITSTPK